MGIRKIQVTRTIENVIKRYLFDGRYPTLQTITHHFSQWLRENTPGAPGFNPIKVLRKQKSSSEDYNKNVDMIYQDISDAYTATIEQGKQIMSDFNYVETERGKMEHELAQLANQIDELMMMANNTDYRYFDGQVISFENMSQVNQSKSSVLINVQNKELTLKENAINSNRIIINPANAKFNVLKPYDATKVLELLDYAFDDTINTAWWQVVKTKQLDTQMTAELVIIFDQEESINMIEYLPHNGSAVDVKIEYTLDGTGFTSINQQGEVDRITGIKSWVFQEEKVKGIKFVFTKTEHDDQSSGFYQYYFGAKNIAIYKKNYLSKGIMYSNPIEFNENVQTISMYAEHEVPFNTDIRYEIALYEDDDKPLEELIWHPISSSDETKPRYAKFVDLNMKETRVVESQRAEATGEIINGMKVFRLLKDNGDGLVSEEITDDQTGETQETFDDIQNPKLFRGINQWKRERTYRPFDGKIPLNSHWEEAWTKNPQNIRVKFLAIGNRLSLSRDDGGVSDNFYRFTTCIYSDQPKSLPLSISVMQTLTSGLRKRLGSYSVYLNKKRLSPSNDEVTLDFVQGWNEIQILYHWGNMEERKDLSANMLPSISYVGKFNFAAETKVRAELNYMEYLDTHSLYSNVSPNNNNYFSIYERQIVLNYLPEDTIFQLVYETNKDLEKHNTIIVKAELERNIETPSITPKIKRIRLLAK